MSQIKPPLVTTEGQRRGDVSSPPAWALPLLLLVFGAAVWLVIGSGLGLIASIKFHSANFLADCASLSYGRVRAAGNSAFLYGFCIPAGTAFGLWQFARASRSGIPLPGLVAIGAAFWHLGVAVGLAGILRGDMSGFENLEMPGYAAPILFTGFIVLGLWGCLAIHHRDETALEPTHWFALAALFWFAWIFSTAALSLFTFPLRGIAQSVIAWWFSGNLLIVWMGLVGLGALFTLSPKSQPAPNRNLGLFIFWTLLLFGSWVGIPAAAPLPAWMPVLSKVFTVLLLLPVLSVAVWLLGAKLSSAESSAPSFARFAGFSFVLYGLTLCLGAFFGADTVTQFTWFKPALDLLGSYGFFGFALFGILYCTLPSLVAIPWPFPKFARTHFYLAAIGLALTVLPLLIGGIMQGLDLRNPNVAVVDVSARTLKFLRPSTLGELLMALGNLLFLLNLAGLLAGLIRRGVTSFVSQTLAPLTVEVKS
jgi:cytochrome c oxidase cbb3-type subunit 1